jgi:hyperosmotically inducible protein
MFKQINWIGRLKLLPIVAVALSFAAMSVSAEPRKQSPLLADEVRHQLLMLPYYSVFDELGFTIKDPNTVVLTGEVTRPIVKSDAENVIRHIEGVEKVVNDVEVLPLSPFDDSIRVASYRAIFSRPGFEKYAIQAVSPIRIIVKNGHITLHGIVGSQFDKTLAWIAAMSVPGVFSVTNNLTVG